MTILCNTPIFRATKCPADCLKFKQNYVTHPKKGHDALFFCRFLIGTIRANKMTEFQTHQEEFMKKKIAAAALAMLGSGSLLADDQPPKATITVDTQVVSNYVFRGADMFINRASQNGEKYGANTGEWAFQPSITYNTPLDGLTFNAWFSYAMAGRGDVDTDQVLQTSAGGADIGTGVTLRSALDTAVPSGTAQANINAPGFYKELNGLRRLDELDLTIGYDKVTSAGRFIFGYVAYTLANPNRGSGGIIAAEPYYGNEVYVGYGLKAFPDLTITVYDDTRVGNTYTKIAYSSSMKMMGDAIELKYGISAGYGAKQLYATQTVAFGGCAAVPCSAASLSVTAPSQSIQGWQDVTGNVAVAHKSGFYVGFNVAYRPDLRFVDPDTAGNPHKPLWVDGGSTVSDGKIADPSRTNGYVNKVINTRLQTAMNGAGNANFSYTPRQDIPKYVYWLNVGYKVDI